MTNFNTAQIPKRGDIYYVDFGGAVGSEQSGHRPAAILQNDIGNKFSPTVMVAPLTSQKTKKRLPTHIKVSSGSAGLAKESEILLEQIRVVDKQRLCGKVGRLPPETMESVNNAISISLGL